MNAIRNLLSVVALLAAVTSSLNAAGGPPELLSYQSYLVDANGVPLGTDGSGGSLPSNYDVIFRIYNSASGGTLIWSEQQTVTIDRGYFSVLLGEGAVVGSEPRPAFSTVFSGIGSDERFIGVAVKLGQDGTFTDILPRLRLLTSPYSFQSSKALALVNPDGQPLVTAEAQAVNISGSVTATSFAGSIAASSINSGVLSADRIPNLNASKITAGTLADARIPNLNASKITAGSFSDARIPLTLGNYRRFSSRVAIGGDFNPSYPLHVSTSSSKPALLSSSSSIGTWATLHNTSSGGSFWHLISTGSNNGEGAGKLIIGSGSEGTNNNVMTLMNSPFKSVGINISSGLLGMLHINGSATNGFSFWATGLSASGGQLLTSDERIKAVTGPSMPQTDLETILSLRVVDYTDKVPGPMGKISKKGFLAQEVAQLIPDAVMRSRNAIPNINEIATSVERNPEQGLLSLTVDAEHGLSQGERVRLIIDHQPLDLDVFEVLSPHSFSVLSTMDAEEVLVYGTEVNDFMTLDYNRLFTTGIGAIQALAAKYNEQQALISELEQRAARADALEAELHRLKSEMQAQSAAQARLESLVMTMMEANASAEVVPAKFEIEHPQASR